MEDFFVALHCRICRIACGTMVDIFEKVEPGKLSMQDMLLACGGLVVDVNDAYSNYLCNECTRELLIAYHFQEKCLYIQELTFMEQIENEQNLTQELTNDCIEIIDETTNNQSTKATDILQQLVDELQVDIEDEPPSHTSQNVDTENCIVYDAYQFIEIEEELEENQSENNQSAINEKKKEFVCDVCGAYFQQHHNLRRHLQGKHPTELCHICSNCNYAFGYEHSYNLHLASCATAGDEHKSSKKSKELKNHLCSYCGKSFNCSSALEMHIRVHTNERPFKCEFCSQTFKTRSSLMNHEQRHTKQPSYSCKFCDKSFYEKGNLKVHMQSHTGEKLHKCLDCGKEFGRVFLLQLHRRTHTGELPYICEVCVRGFKQSTDLFRHQNVHSHFKCDKCGEMFKKRNLYLIHMENNCDATDNWNVPENSHIAENEMTASGFETFEDDFYLENFIEVETNDMQN